MNLRIILADDHAVVRTGLEIILRERHDLEVVAEAESGNDLMQKLKRTPAELVILDMKMPGRDGMDVLKDIKSLYPEIKVIVYSMNREEQYALRMLRGGASAYISKESNVKNLLTAIDMVKIKGKYLTPEQAELIAIEHIEGERSYHALSDREFQILKLIAKGFSNSQMADSLFVSKNTVSNHRSNILRKLNFESNAEITRYAIENSLLD